MTTATNVGVDDATTGGTSNLPRLNEPAETVGGSHESCQQMNSGFSGAISMTKAAG